MIVRCDLHSAGNFVENRVIRAAMPEFELVRLATQRQPQDLVAEADAENRYPADQLSHLSSLILERFRIAGTIREKNTLRLKRKHVFGGRRRRHHGQPAAEDVLSLKAQGV